MHWPVKARCGDSPRLCESRREERSIVEQDLRSAQILPNGTDQEGTPEISFKKNGYFYITFHGAFGTSPVWGYRGIAKTADFHKWLTHADDPADSYLLTMSYGRKGLRRLEGVVERRNGLCRRWHASSLINTCVHVYVIESTDISLDARRTNLGDWTSTRAKPFSHGKSQRFVPSGHWQQYGQNPLINAPTLSMRIQYQRFFVDGVRLYLTYWTIETIGSTPRVTR